MGGDEADLLLAEAPHTEATGQTRAIFGHMVGAEAALLALRAGAKRLLLTHQHPALDCSQVLAEAQAIFPTTELAVEMSTYPVG
jgi:ribonuclease Z